jgi:hypothetical protein
MDYTVDYEVSTTPFVQEKVVPPDELGSVIPSNHDVVVPKNQILAVSDLIVPVADKPVVGMLADGSINAGRMIAEYARTISQWLSQYYTMLSKNETISQLFKDNAKIISVLIAIAAGSFIVNAGVSAVVVGIILLIALKNVSNLF